MYKSWFQMIISAIFVIFGLASVNAQTSSSCFSKTGTISANIQVFHADKVDEPVIFDASNSAGVGDFFKEPIEWDFGDGFKAKMCRSTHVYRNAGTYTVTLKVKDNQGNISIATTQVAVNAIPAATGNNILTVVTTGSGNGTTTFNTIQAAVNKAATLNSSGTVEIIIPAGATFIENVELKVSQGNNYITLKSSALGNLPNQQRADRSNLQNFATIKSPPDNNNVPALRTELKNSSGGACTVLQTCSPAHNYRLQGIQFTVDPGTYSAPYEKLVAIGFDESIQNEESEQAHHIIIDRCLFYREDYSTSNPNPQLIKNGIESEGTHLSVLDSHFSGINAPGIESHAMSAYNSTGIWGVINNYFESGGIPFIVGGAEPSIPNAVVQDVEFRRNRFHKPLEKRFLPVEHKWNAKNNFEIKSGKYWIIEDNLFDGNWLGSNQRYNVNFNALPDDTGAQSTVQDIQFTNNIIKQGPAGILVGRVANNFPNAPFPARIMISYNLFTELGGAEYGTPGCQSVSCEAEGQGFVISNIPINLIIRHNTMLLRKNIMDLDGQSHQTIVFQDNITNHGTAPYQDGWGYGIKSPDGNSGCTSIDPSLPGCSQVQSSGVAYFPNAIFNRNVIANVLYDNRYPNNAPYPYQSLNYYFAPQNPSSPVGLENIDNHFVNRAGNNYHIASASPGKNGASDGTDVGANIDRIDVVGVNAVTGIWNTTSTQTPYPGSTAPTIPLTLEVENYDNGGEGISYHDNDTGNSGGAYRSNDVDIRARATASNGYEVFGASAGEWMEYTINVPFTRNYDIGVRYASEFNNGVFRIQDCGSNPNNQNCTSPVELTGPLTITSTGNWSNFRVITKRGITLSAGIHVLRLKMDSNATDGCACVVADFDAILFKSALFDYDGDGRADISVWRPSDGNWYLDRSKNGFTAINLGSNGDIIAPADFDGDGLSDISVFRPSTGIWYRFNSSNSQYIQVYFGQSGDIPIQADYDGDGKADIAVFRPSTGVWYWINSSNGSSGAVQFGLNGDRPAVGDYDGDGKADLAVFRPSNGVWYLQQSTAGFLGISFGLSTDLITPADYDGDGKTDIAVFRPSDGTWYRFNSSNGQYIGIQFGQNGDKPAPADFDGDGKDDVAIYRPSSGNWYLLRSTESVVIQNFGLNGDVPIPSTFTK